MKGKIFAVYAVQAFRDLEVQLHAFLTLALHGGEWSALHPSCFIPKETARGTH
jgi:hypothetical protein